jgi:CRISPR/Cas system-associated exonuclease Cas4 (RecB family)
MSVSLLHEIEECPYKWALQRADYPDVWAGRGYPNRIHVAGVIGTIIHLSVERIVGELVKAGCVSMNDMHAVTVMRSLGGYTAVIQSYIEQELESYKFNPRIEVNLDQIRSSLLTSISDIRSKVQLLLGRMTLYGMKLPMPKQPAAPSSKERRPLSYGIHPEVEIYAPDLHWRGRADLIIFTESLCELVDFKTGEYNKWHEFQMRLYALLWNRDSVLNPTTRSIDKLTLSYLHEDIDVSIPTGNSLEAFEREVKDRTKECTSSLSIIPPRPRPNIGVCSYCDTRHLCEIYWDINNRYVATSEKLSSDFTDVEVTLEEQHGLLSWNVTIEASPYLSPGSSALLRIPANHYLAKLAKQRKRIRILCTGVYTDSIEEPNSIIVTLNKNSEVYFMEDNIDS